MIFHQTRTHTISIIAIEMPRRTLWSNLSTFVGRENCLSLYEPHPTVQILDALGGFSSSVMPDQTRTKSFALYFTLSINYMRDY